MNAHAIPVRLRQVYLVLFLLTIGGVLSGKAQRQLATDNRVTNIRLTAVNQTSLEILYDLAVSNPNDSIYVEITGRKSGILSYSPGFIEGDFGRHVVAGPNRRIVWNVLANGYELNEEIRVRVLVKINGAKPGSSDSTARQQRPTTLALTDTVSANQRNRSYRPGGPLTALLSVVVPGLGNVFVQGPRPKIGLRPLLTAGVVGAIAYGLNQRSQADGLYKLYEQQKNSAEGETYYQQANQQHHRYYLATRAAAAIWLSDVVFTLIRGIHNQSVRREPSPVSLRLGYQATTPVAAFTLRLK